MTARDLDRRFDDGEQVSAECSRSRARRPGSPCGRAIDQGFLSPSSPAAATLVAWFQRPRTPTPELP